MTSTPIPSHVSDALDFIAEEGFGASVDDDAIIEHAACAWLAEHTDPVTDATLIDSIEDVLLFQFDIDTGRANAAATAIVSMMKTLDNGSTLT